MGKKNIFPLAAIATMGLAFSFNGCQCSASAHAGEPPQTATAATPPPPAPPTTPSAPTPAPAPAAPPKIVAVGKATLEGNKVRIPGELEFDLNKASIKHTTQSDEILNTLVEFMKQNSNVTKLRIEGHTDNSGTDARNNKLSQDRADAVVKWLTDHGVDPGRLTSQGFGSTKPLVANDTDEHKHMNRRTEFHVAEINGQAAGGASSSSASAAAPAGSAGTTSTTAAPATTTK